MSPVRYELGFYIPEDGILHSHRRDNLKSYIRFARFSCDEIKLQYLFLVVGINCSRMLLLAGRRFRRHSGSFGPGMLHHPTVLWRLH
jgi:hypothetical protein